MLDVDALLCLIFQDYIDISDYCLRSRIIFSITEIIWNKCQTVRWNQRTQTRHEDNNTNLLTILMNVYLKKKISKK